MRYKAKSIAALDIILDGLPDNMRVEVEVRWRPSEADNVARKSSDNNSAGAPSRKRGKGEQG
jgi:hypothetical protein